MACPNSTGSKLDGQTRHTTNKHLHVDVEDTRHTPKNNNNKGNMKRSSLFRFASNCKTIKLKIQKIVVQLSLNGSMEEIWPFRGFSGSEHEKNANDSPRYDCNKPR